MVINTGGRDIVIDKLAVRGQEAPGTQDQKFVLYKITTDPISTDFEFIDDFTATSTQPDDNTITSAQTYR